MKHKNNGCCDKCQAIAFQYQGINQDLWNWFQMMQAKCPEFHISEAGRGQERQNQMFKEGKSRAKWLESAHNFNCAIDTFVMLPGVETLYPKQWYMETLRPEIPNFLTWLGESTRFPELPHIEVREWRKLLFKNAALCVEPGPWRV